MQNYERHYLVNLTKFILDQVSIDIENRFINKQLIKFKCTSLLADKLYGGNSPNKVVLKDHNLIVFLEEKQPIDQSLMTIKKSKSHIVNVYSSKWSNDDFFHLLPTYVIVKMRDKIDIPSSFEYSNSLIAQEIETIKSAEWYKNLNRLLNKELLLL